MKKTLLTLVIATFVQVSYAQFTGGPTGLIYYTGGNTSIGTTTDNGNKLQINGSITSLGLNVGYGLTTTGNAGIRVDGGNTGSNTGASISFYNNNSLLGLIGNYSTFSGGAYDGRFGIWSGNPIYTRTNLVIKGALDDGTNALQVTGSSNFTGDLSASGNSYFNGNVGIGTTSPATKLDVVGGATFRVNANNYLTINYNGNPPGGNKPLLDYTIDNHSSASYYPPAYFNAVGAIGISTNSYFCQGCGGDGFQIPSSSNAVSWDLSMHSVPDGIGGTGADNFSIRHAAPTSGLPAFSTYFYINEGGNVGIGTKSPRDKLDLSTHSGTNLIIGDRVSVGSLIGSAATVIGQNIKADNIADNQMSFINTTSDGASAIKMQYNQGIAFHTNNSGGTSGSAFSSERLRITPSGNVAIGTTDPQGYRLAVNGSAIATSMTVKLYADWPDYVFKKGYKLSSLTDVKTYIDKNQHLPDMPSEQDVAKNGINLGEIVKLQTKKIEELTLYAIEQQKQIEQQQANHKQDEARIAALEAALTKLTANGGK